MSVPTRIVLEPAAQEFADAASKPPLIYELDYGAARSVLDEIQAAPVDKLPVDEEWITVPSAGGDARVRLVKPPAADGVLPAILYMHGGGWVLGNAGTHDRLVRELAVGTGAAVVFVEYDRSPEARDRPVDRPGGRRAGARPGPDGGRRRRGGGRHARRDRAHGAGARRRAFRAPVDVLPGHRRGDGYRLLRAVRGGLLPHRQGDGVVLGLLLPGPRPPRRAVCFTAA